jgi:endonuclease YncB( thermonuclease family)
VEDKVGKVENRTTIKPNETTKREKRNKKKSMVRLTGVVRAVSSGDTFSILQVATDGSGNSNEFQFSLMGLKAPQLGRRGNNQQNQNQNQSQQQKPEQEDIKDEAWAFQSREFLREKLIGKAIIFRVEYTTENGRRFGEAWLGEEDLRNSVVKNGWAAIPPRKDVQGNLRPVNKEDQALVTLQEEAKAKAIGIFKPVTDASIRKVNYHDFSDQKKENAFFEKNKNTKKKAIVEQVRNGSQLRLYLVDSRDEIIVNLSGIRCPQLKSKESNNPEKYANDAKFYAEHKLLNRTVSLTLDFLDKFNYYGTVVDDQGKNIALGLLEFGLAQIVEWNIPTTIDAKVFQTAENTAKNGHIRLWQNQQSNNNNNKNSNQNNSHVTKNATGKVIEVNSLGTITVRVIDNQHSLDQKFHFSSIRVPRLPPREISPDSNKGKQQNKKGGSQSADRSTESDESKRANEEKDKERAQQDLMREKLAAIDQKRSISEMTPEAKDIYLKNEEEKKKKLELEKEQGAYAILGKDYLRKKLIGKTVRCVFDYSQTEKDDKFSHNNKYQNQPSIKHFYSIYTEGKNSENVAIDIVRQGFAHVVNHSDNQPRSPEYRELTTAEREAQKESKGLHQTKQKPTVPIINDLSGAPEKKVTPFLTLLKNGKQQGVVEMVWSTKKFKIYLPLHGVQIVFSLAGADMPLHIFENNPPNPIGKGDFFVQYPLINQNGTPNIYNEAYHYSRDHLLQRDVEIEVLELAKFGNSFVGKLYLTQGNNKQGDDFSLDLLRRGYIRVNNFVCKKVFSEAQTNVLLSTEQTAKNEKKGFWANYNEKKEKEIHDTRNEKRASDRAELQANTSSDRSICIVVTEIVSGSSFYYQVATEKSKSEIEDLMKEFGAINFAEKPAFTPVMAGPSTSGGPPAPLPRVAGNFSVDNTWYRAEVLEIISATTSQPALYKLRYIDYGNTETVTVDRIRALPAEFQKQPAQAKRAKLAYITAPEMESEYGPEAADFFKSLCWGKDLLANIQFTTTGREKGSKIDTEIHHITLGDEETKIFINAAMVMNGFACVDNKKKLPSRGVKWPMWDILREEEEIAKKDRLNIWQYGEYGSDDDEKKQFSKKGKK